MARKTTAEIEIKGTDSASTTFSKVGSSAKKMGGDIKQSGDQTVKAQSSFSKFSNFLKSRFVITLGDVSRAVGGIFRAIKDASDLSSQTNALKLSLAQQGQSFDTYLDKLKEVSRGTISTADLIKSSSKALLLGIPAEEIAKLLDIARASAIATGQTVTAAFDDIATGIGRSSPLILDNLGIVVKIGKANEKYAKQIGKVVSELTAQEQKQALLNEVLAVGEDRIETFGESADKTTIALQKGTAAMIDFKIAIANIGTGVLSLIVAQLSLLGAGAVGAAEGMVILRQQWNEFTGDLEEAEGLQATVDRLGELRLSIFQSSNELNESALLQLGKSLGIVAADVGEATISINESFGSTVEAAQDMSEAVKDTIPALGDMADEIEDTAAASNSTLLPAMEQLNSEIERTGQVALVAAQGFDQLAASQGRAAAVAAQFAANQAAGFADGGLSVGGTRIRIPGGSRLVDPPGFSNISDNGDSNGRPGDNAFSKPFLNS